MTRFVARRMLQMIPVLFFVSVIIFVLINLVPGDAARLFLGEEAPPDALAALRHELGLDRPLYTQYLRWVGGMLRGDFGHSFKDNRKVLATVLQKVPVTGELTIAALLIAWTIAIPAGVVAAWRRRTAVDYSASAAALTGLSIPNFWLGIMLIYLFAVHLRWLPASGFVPLCQDPALNLKTIVMPAFVLGVVLAAVVMRQLRSSMLEVLSADYVRTANAKGLGGRVVLIRHALRNAVIPVITVMGIQMGTLLGGAVITETIFALPGLGRLAVESIYGRDYPMLEGVVMFSALAVLAINLAVDIVYSLIDPRIKLAGSGA
ncbi:MAG: ABC transporter permease [Bacillati bacterium ANGP1]|uniref:ABC transporter permease n=1 Tax=Candidatus Segetimicrobium genomatis TaxID=2569760 RepID=A0A537JJE5_9BACT|nr:MAG: ABC transporter permease [Terrabacteria group bacterium ANGP1]